MANVSLTAPTDFAAEQADIERRRKYAELLTQQSMQPTETQTAGGWTIPTSWTQHAAKMLQGYLGGQGQRQATEQSRALGTSRNQALAAALSGMPQATQQTTDNWRGTNEPGDAPVNTPQTSFVQPSPQAQASWLGKLEGLGGNAVGIGNTMLTHQQKTYENEEARSARLLQTAMQLDARSQDRELSLAQRSEAQAQSEALRRELAAGQQSFQESQAARQREWQTNENRQRAEDRRALVGATSSAGRVPAGYRTLPNGNMEAIPGGPADIKAQKQAETVDSGRGTVSSLVTQLRDYYDQLQQGGGITDPSKGAVSNVGAGVASSGVGQFAGRLFGTQNQSARNSIAQQRPLLLNAIKQATGMSAKQMDSNAELKLYLSAATDPTLDVQANRNALDMLEKLYGIAPAASAPPAPAPTPAKSGRGRRSTDNPNVIDFNSLPPGR